MDSIVFMLKIFYGALFCFAGAMHLIKPELFKHFIPDFLPKKLVNYVVGIVEFSVGFGLFFPETKNIASLGIIILLLTFLPIHIWDLTKKRPAIGTKKVAIIRIPLQFLLLYGIYLVFINSSF